MSNMERVIELERADAARRALEEAAKQIETQKGGQTYQKALKTAAAILRRMKATL
jgi:hypothetical protein